MTRPLKSHGISTEKDPRTHRLRYRVKAKGPAASQADRIKRGHELLQDAVHSNPGRFVPAAQVLLDFFARETNQTKIGPQDEDRAYTLMERFISHLLFYREYDKVAGILWPKTLFTAEPYSVSEVWRHVAEHQQAFIVGPGGVGKSYSLAAWLLIDWMADPEWTHVKLLSVTKAHAEKNIFAHVKNLHAASAFPIPGEVLANSIRVGSRQNSGFQLTTIPQGDSGAGRLRGCHPDPRPKPHPKFGTHSRIRIALDEAELIGDGAYIDIGNLLLTEGSDADHMKIIAATNPKDQSTPFGRCCEPPFGWKDISPEGSHCWKGQNGVQVLRLDGAKTENVRQKKLVYPGFMTYEGYQRYIERGANDSEAWTMARGFWPPSGTVGGYILPTDQFDKAETTADFIFTGTPIEIGAVDTALEGGDDCVFGHGRFGWAWGVQMPDGRKIKFPKHIPCLQAIQATVLPKGDAVSMGKAIKAAAEGCNILPENLILDITGNGSGPYAWLRHYWTEGEIVDIKGIDSGTSASDMPIFQEDSQIASERFKGMHSELCFSGAAWLQFGYLKMKKGFPVAEIRREATSRQYLTQGKLRVVEKKETFKARLRCNSPDRWDMLCLMVQRARQIDMGTMQISMTRPEQVKAEPKDWFKGSRGEDPSDAGVEFIDLN